MYKTIRLGGKLGSSVSAINASGESVGYSNTVIGDNVVLWSPSGTATVLQDVGGRGDSVDAINDAGQSVGSSPTAGGGSEAVLWGPKTRDVHE